MRFVLLAALAVVAAVPGVAQPVVGVRASGVYTTASVSNPFFRVSIGDAIGVGAGAFTEVPITPMLSVVADVGYAQGGAGGQAARTTVPSPEPSAETDGFLTRTHAITVAPALSATLRTDDIEPFLFLGPRIDIKLAERSEIDGVPNSTDDFPDTAVGLAGGAGVAAGRGRLDLRASILWGVDSAIRQSAVELRLGVTL